MQNAQNTDIQRVKNLVDLYRKKVTYNSDIAKDKRAKEDSSSSFDNDFFLVEIEGYSKEKLNQIRVDEQLLGHFYSKVAGNETDKTVLNCFLPHYYDKSIFSSEEESFLTNHFKEMVNYILQRPYEDPDIYSFNDSIIPLSIPEEVLDLIKNRFEIVEGSVIYNPFPSIGQFSKLYNNCKFYIADRNALKELALFANNVDATIIKEGELPSNYDVVLTFLPWVNENQEAEMKDTTNNLLLTAYNNLHDGGKYLVLCPKSLLWNKPFDYYVKEPNYDDVWYTPKSHLDFRNQLVNDGSIEEIIQLPDVFERRHGEYCVLIGKKGSKAKYTTMIDASYAFKPSSNIDYLVLDNDAVNDMISNNGINTDTGYRKMIRVRHEELKPNMLLPQTYVIERPAESDCPIPLSELCTLFPLDSLEIWRSKLPEKIPVLRVRDLSRIHWGEFKVTDLDKIENKDLSQIKDSIDVNSWGFLYNRVYGYFDGKRDAVFFKIADDGIGIKTALVRATNVPMAVEKSIGVLCVNQGVNVKQLLAIIRQPIVYRQIRAYFHVGLFSRLNEIMVPWNLRILIEAGKELLNQEKVHEEYLNRIAAMKTEYINEVRMRKHDMGQKVFDLINTEDLMRYYVENRETESDVWSQIEEQLDHFRSTIHELSDMLDQLSQEEQFGTPELLDLNGYFANLQHSNNVNGFTLSYQLDRDSILDLQLSRMKDKDIKDMNMVKVIPTVFVAKNDLQRVVSNILTNAQRHGFLDPDRKDYEVNIRLEFNAEKGMYQIDFRNNGKPLPEGLNKLRYGIKGEKAGQTAGAGLGGSVVKSIVEHYKGDYDVFMDGEWTVIRVYLPIAI